MGLDLALYRYKDYQKNIKTDKWLDNELAYGRKTWSIVSAFKFLDGIIDDEYQMIVRFDALNQFIETYQPVFTKWEDYILSYIHLDNLLEYPNEDAAQLREQDQQALESAHYTLEQLLMDKLGFIDQCQLGFAWELAAWVRWIDAIQKEINNPEHDSLYYLSVSY